MKKSIITIFTLPLVFSAIYYGSYLLLTNKYTIPYTSGACDIARTVNHEWQRKLFSPAAAIEMILFGKEPHKLSIQIHSEELHEYFHGQQILCKAE